MFRRTIVAVLLLLGGCLASNPYAPVPKELAIKIRVFEDTVRWGDLRKTYLFGRPGSRVEIPGDMDNIRVTRYEAGEIREVAPWRWEQTAVIDYVLTDRQVVKQLLDHQIWASDDEGRSWYRVNPPPRFR